MDEKRRYSRAKVNIPTFIRVGGSIAPATIVDLSRNGMGLILDSDIKSAPVAEIIFDLPEKGCKDLSVRGRIVRKEGSGPSKIGLEFTSPFSSGQQILRSYIKTLNPGRTF